MTKKEIAATLVIALIALLLFGWASRANSITYIAPTATTTPEIIAPVVAPKPSARQEVWIDALEWCESRGNPKAINPKDRDNTPSFGILQFKPDTFAYYAEKLNLGDVLLMDPVAQHQIVEYMVMSTTTDWMQQFPDCVENHIGYPPKV